MTCASGPFSGLVELGVSRASWANPEGGGVLPKKT